MTMTPEEEAAKLLPCIMAHTSNDCVDEYIDEFDRWCPRCRSRHAVAAALREAYSWREVVTDLAVTNWTLTTENQNDPDVAVRDLLRQVQKEALDPAISSEAHDLHERIAALEAEVADAKKVIAHLNEQRDAEHECTRLAAESVKSLRAEVVLCHDAERSSGEIRRALDERLAALESLLRQERELLQHDVITYGTDADGGPVRCIIINDTFAYGTADAEELSDENLPVVYDAWRRWSHDGLTAWVALRRGAEPIPPAQTERYSEARAALAEVKR